MIPAKDIKLLSDERFIKTYELLNDGAHRYVCASRRSKQDLMACKTTQESQCALPDAVSCYVIVDAHSNDPRLLLSYEYRYPAGQYLLSVPAGLIDPADLAHEDPIRQTALRELKEETGIAFTADDIYEQVAPFVWSTPGFTDESNALVRLSINRPVSGELSQAGAEGTEAFDGFELVSRDQAAELLQNGRDKHGIYLPIFTYLALMDFVSWSSR